jgi:hypothetical protein
MKNERGVLQDVIGTAQPNEESKAKKYVRIALTMILMSAFALLIVMAVLRRYGS